MISVRRQASPARRRVGGWLEGRLLAQRLEAAITEHFPWAAPYLAGALAGDEEAARSLVFGVGDEARGHVALALHLHDVPPAVMREALEFVWSKDHRSLQAAVPNRQRLVSMFRHAAFPPPSHLPETFKVWRGVYGVSVAVGARGVAWTRNRRLACWFASSWRRAEGAPLVLTGTVRREDVALYTNERSEDEVVSFKVQDVRVDPADVSEWLAAGADLERERQEQNQQRFATA